MRASHAVCKEWLHWETAERGGGCLLHLSWVTKGGQAANKPARDTRSLGRDTLQLPSHHRESLQSTCGGIEGPRAWCCHAGVAVPAVTPPTTAAPASTAPRDTPATTKWEQGVRARGLWGAQARAGREGRPPPRSPVLPSRRGSARAATSAGKQTCRLSRAPKGKPMLMTFAYSQLGELNQKTTRNAVPFCFLFPSVPFHLL